MTNGITQEQEQETNTVVPSRSSTQNAPEENITEGESGGRCQSKNQIRKAFNVQP